MYICICHGLKESDVFAARTAGAEDAKSVFSSFGVEPQCGRCVAHLHGLLCQGACSSKGRQGADPGQSCKHSKRN